MSVAEKTVRIPRLPLAGRTMVPLPGRVDTGHDTRLSDSTKMLLALSRTQRHFYEGTVPRATVERRRAKNRAARRARRVHRG